MLVNAVLGCLICPCLRLISAKIVHRRDMTNVAIHLLLSDCMCSCRLLQLLYEYLPSFIYGVLLIGYSSTLRALGPAKQRQGRFDITLPDQEDDWLAEQLALYTQHIMQAFRRSAAQTARAVARQQTKRYAHHEAPAAGSIKYPEEEKLGVRVLGG